MNGNYQTSHVDHDILLLQMSQFFVNSVILFFKKMFEIDHGAVHCFVCITVVLLY